MWLQVGLASGAVVVLLAVLRRMMTRRKSQHIDVGPVSESWLAEQRARRTDSL
jgi:membrane protein implicated in regulation of membrane protease activity